MNFIYDIVIPALLGSFGSWIYTTISNKSQKKYNVKLDCLMSLLDTMEKISIHCNKIILITNNYPTKDFSDASLCFVNENETPYNEYIDAEKNITNLNNLLKLSTYKLQIFNELDNS